jgi:hypothetical protein
VGGWFDSSAAHEGAIMESVIICILAGVGFGFITRYLAGKKGYSGGFAWGFFLGIIGLIVVAARPNKVTSSGGY